MRYRIVSLTFLAALMFFVMSARLIGQPPSEPKELPAGLYCNPKGIVGNNGLVIDPSHKCNCKHQTVSKDCEGYIQEMPTCSQFCHKEKCKCPVVCIDPEDVHDH